MTYTDAEARARAVILEKDKALRLYLAEHRFTDGDDPSDWLAYLAGLKNLLGNVSNDLGFVATLLVKRYLAERFGIDDFDAAAKAQGASGIDIEARTPDGQSVIGELKTTKPYQPGFGAQQRTMMIKDLARLAAARADHRLMFVTDPESFATLCKPSWAARAPGVEIVDLATGRTFLCPLTAGEVITPKAP
jgi:hypothetical protein